tara:strand:- start:1187 stop:1546 length:360 start_codon:yes stop_codon:yes gene_type:complete
MAYYYPSARVGVPVHVRAEAIYLRNEGGDETVACFVTREEVVVPSGSIVRVPVDCLSVSAARAIWEHMQAQHAGCLNSQLKSKEFAEAMQTINSIIEEDDIRLARLQAETAAAKVRKVR